MNKLPFYVLLLIFSTSLLFSGEFCYSRKWLNILFYDKQGDSYISLADTSDFFITQEGKTDPKAEYEASLKLVEANDLSFKTKFPLRYKYIANNNNFKYEPVVQVANNIENVVIAYPNRYMSNPASMFGHLYLVLKTNKGLLDSDILHYVADTKGVGGFNYLLGGLVGEFEGWFLREPYYKEVKNYTYVEDRDIIYYDLKLFPEQIEDLQLAYIELQNYSFYYYFLDKNCAFIIGKLLNVILLEDIVKKEAYVMPSQIINKLIDASLLENKLFRVSNTKLFNNIFNKLSGSDKKKVIKLFFKKHPNVQYNKEILKSFLLISEYVISNYSSMSDTVRFNRIEAYKRLRELNVFGVRQKDIKSKSVSRIKSESVGVSGLVNGRYEFVYNPVYFSEYSKHDKIDIKSVKCLGIKLKLNPNDSNSLKFNIVDLKNITQYNELLNTFSWEVKSSIIYNDSFLTNQEFNYGLAFNFLNNGLIYSLIGLNYTSFDDITDVLLVDLNFIPAIKIGLNQNLTENLKFFVSYENRFKKDYIKAELLYKHDNLLNKLMLINEGSSSILKLSFEFLF